MFWVRLVTLLQIRVDSTTSLASTLSSRTCQGIMHQLEGQADESWLVVLKLPDGHHQQKLLLPDPLFHPSQVSFRSIRLQNCRGRQFQ